MFKHLFMDESTKLSIIVSGMLANPIASKTLLPIHKRIIRWFKPRNTDTASFASTDDIARVAKSYLDEINKVIEQDNSHKITVR